MKPNNKKSLTNILFIFIVVLGSYVILSSILYIINVNRKINVDKKIINKIKTNLENLDDDISLINNLEKSKYSDNDLKELKRNFNELNEELSKKVSRFKSGEYTIIKYYDIFYNENRFGNDECNTLIVSKEKKIKEILGKYLGYNDNRYELLKKDFYGEFLGNVLEQKGAYHAIINADYSYFEKSNKYILSKYDSLVKEYIILADIVLEIGR